MLVYCALNLIDRHVLGLVVLKLFVVLVDYVALHFLLSKLLAHDELRVLLLQDLPLELYCSLSTDAMRNDYALKWGFVWSQHCVAGQVKLSPFGLRALRQLGGRLRVASVNIGGWGRDHRLAMQVDAGSYGSEGGQVALERDELICVP